ncbi:flagellar FlbD family protein [Bdellovibrionota bacterium FG-2]
MIHVSRLGGQPFVVNCEMIKYIEATPDTLLTLVTGDKIMVRESVQEVIEKSVEYRKKLFEVLPLSSGGPPASKPAGN